MSTSSPPGPLSDEELRRLRNRHPEAIRQHVYDRRDYLRAVLRRYTDTDEQAEDLLQETFFQVLRSLPDFRGDARFSTWLYSVAKNVALAHYRSSQRHQFVEQEALTRMAEQAQGPFAAADAPPVRDPADQTMAQERKALVHDALDELSDTYQEVVRLRDLEELSTQETAERLGLSRVNVRVRLHRARKQLTDVLEDRMPAGDRAA